MRLDWNHNQLGWRSRRPKGRSEGHWQVRTGPVDRLEWSKSIGLDGLRHWDQVGWVVAASAWRFTVVCDEVL
jgi:hypothetical protein